MVEERFNAQTKSGALGPKHYEHVNSLEQKLIKLQDLFIDGELNRNEFNQAKNRYENLLNELKEKEEVQKKKSEILKIYKQGFKKLESIDTQFIESDVENKRRLLGSMFPEKFQFEENRVRTADINPLLLKIASINKGYKGNKKRDKSNNNDLSQEVLKTGLEPVRTNVHWILSPTCLPIPPLQHAPTALSTSLLYFKSYRAKNGIRTRDLHLGKVALYQLSYFRGLFMNAQYCYCGCKFKIFLLNPKPFMKINIIYFKPVFS